MEQKMTWEEIKRNYPDEWVAVVDYTPSGAIGVEGIVKVHARERKSLYKQVKSVRKNYKDITFLYTGQLIKNPDVPLLWQISRTK